MIMRQAELEKYMETLETCEKLRYDACKLHGILPNELRFLPMKPILVSKRSENGEDFAVSQGGVKYCIELENQTAGVQGYVLLIDRNRSYVSQTTVREFLRKMNGIQPRPSDDPRYGPYWWVDDQFRYAGSTSSNPVVDQAPWL
jgi:hypothetical protein